MVVMRENGGVVRGGLSLGRSICLPVRPSRNNSSYLRKIRGENLLSLGGIVISLESSHENPRIVVKRIWYVCMVVLYFVCSQRPKYKKTFPKKPANIYSSNQRRTKTKRSPNDCHPRVPEFNWIKYTVARSQFPKTRMTHYHNRRERR